MAELTEPFIDPVSQRECAVHFGGDQDGVEHPDCEFRAEVTPELDAWFCRHCSTSGRISGAWFMDLLERANGERNDN